MLPAEQAFHNIDRLPLFEKWCNIKHAFKSFTGKKADSMVRMLNVIGQELVGTHHSGIDDARNIASIARWLCQEGYFFKSTSEGRVDEWDLQHQHMLQEARVAVKVEEEATRLEKLAAGAVPPQDMFRDSSQFSAWDTHGLPTLLLDGTPVSRSSTNKRKKMWQRQKLLHEKLLATAQIQS